MRRTTPWMLSGVLMSTTLLTACVNTTSDRVVLPPLVTYSGAFQDRLAGEFQAMRPACGPETVYDGCSAAKRVIMDYKRMRDQVRAVKP